MDSVFKFSKYLILGSVFLASISGMDAQRWEIVNSRSIENIGRIDIVPEEYLIAYIDDSALKEVLWNAPKISDPNGKKTLLNVMLPNRRVDKFSIFEYSMMEGELTLKFPKFKTFIGYSESDPSRTIRIDYTAMGFRSVISDRSGKTYIDNYQNNDNNHKIIYSKKDLKLKDQWICLVDDSFNQQRISSNLRLAGDCQLREYRLAVAATGEYTAFHGGTVSLGMSAIITAINRVNEIYENDLSIRLVLIGNNDLLVYTNSNTDPYNNDNGLTMLNQNQSNIDAVIGNNNYDVGHVFSTGGGGVASLGSACTNSVKARGVTGLPNPIGDPFYIDYVSHELGHQFGANHTFNGDEGGCSGNRNDATAFEPGSGSTIMGYAGICGSTQNVQTFSDAYFHAISIQEISTHITQPTDCSTTSNNNDAPVASPLLNYNVPISTPLVLEASASDSNGDMLTYCWEQMDNETGYTIPPASSNVGGPMFRSLTPTNNPERYLPSIDNIVNGTTDTWEVLPSVTRNLNFRMTVRDNALTHGCTDEENMIINVSATAGPFVVTSFNSPDTFLEGESVSITWDVSNTDIAPINATLVDILLSYDGGYTYPETLATAVPNDGSQVVTIPVGITSTGRIMVRGNGNIFFDINDSDFEIQAGGSTYTLSSNPSTGEVCNSSSVQFNVLTSSINGFSTPISLAVSGYPAGTTTNISPNSVTPGNSAIVTLDNF